MKKILFIVTGFLVVIVFLWITIFYWTNLRGLWPAIQKPKEDISKLINTTGMPLTLPPGFSISVFAKNLMAPRVMTIDPSGNLLVSITAQGRVVALPDRNKDGVADEIVTVIDGLNRPHGLTFRCTDQCRLYIAETDQVAVYDYDNSTLKAINKRTVVALPGGGNHFTRTILFRQPPHENELLISVGSTCNVCYEDDWRRAKILTIPLDAVGIPQDELRVFASGLRNSVFMAFHPFTGQLWVTEMGRDFLGDDLPPDEINIIEDGKNYGWPICYGKNIHDIEFDKNLYLRDPCQEPWATPSYIDIAAHSSPLGLAFIPEVGWPEEYRHNLLVAYHGSWNRSVPTGYKIVRYKLDEQGHYLGEEDFISGWLTEKGVLGRPTDILIQPGGIIYISDDKAGIIYRVTYQQPQTTVPDKSNLIKVIKPSIGELISSPLIIEGEARGFWFFEDSFLVKLLDANGQLLARGRARALAEWMTENFVPFRAELKFEKPATQNGTLILEKDNPSGLPENADELRLQIRFY